MNKKKIGVLLSGCGVFDGTEVHESVLTLLYIDQAGADAICSTQPKRNPHYWKIFTKFSNSADGLSL